MRLVPAVLVPAAFLLIGCTADGDAGDAQPQAQAGSVQAQARPSEQRPFRAEPIGEFDEPWAMTFLPDGNLLVTEKRGRLKLRLAETGLSTSSRGVRAPCRGLRPALAA